MRMLWRVLLIVIGFAGVLATGYAWIVASPTGAYPDDDYHQTSIWCPRPIEDHCAVVGIGETGRPIVEVPETVDASSITFAFNKDASAGGLSNLSDDILQGTTRVDDGDYPEYYYNVMHLLVSNDVDRSILTMRWVNFSIAVLLYGAALLLLGNPQRRLLGYTLVCGALPINLYFTASVNPSSWAFTGIVSLWIGLEGFFTSHGARRAGLACVALIGAGLAAAARVDSAIYCGIVAVVMVVFHFRRVWSHKLLLLLPLVTALIGAASYVATTLAPSMTVAAEPVSDAGPHINPIRLFASNMYHLPRFLLHFWDTDLGWFDVPSPSLTGVLLILVTVIWVGYCFIRVRCDWHKIAALIVIGGSVYGLPVFLMQTQLTYLAVWGFQARYVAPLMIVFFGMLMTGSPRNDPPRLPWWLSVPCLAALVVAHSLLLHTLIRRYVTGMDVPGFNLDAAVEWWRTGGPSPMWTWVIGSVGLACAVMSMAVSIQKKGEA